MAKSLLLLKLIIGWSHDPSSLGREVCEGAPKTSPMNVPMILLNILDELQVKGAISVESAMAADIDVKQEEEWCVAEIMKHVRSEWELLLLSLHTSLDYFASSLMAD